METTITKSIWILEGKMLLHYSSFTYLRVVVERCGVVILDIFTPCCEECERVKLIMFWLLTTADQLLIIEQFRGELKMESYFTVKN